MHVTLFKIELLQNQLNYYNLKFQQVHIKEPIITEVYIRLNTAFFYEDASFEPRGRCL